MDKIAQFQATLDTYRKHGWQLRRILMRPETMAELRHTIVHEETQFLRFDGVEVRESSIDALWFARAAQAGREAWELRLIADSPYALFELFEPDEIEEDREDVRREMEARIKDK